MLTDDFTKWSISKSKGSTNPYILFSDLANYEFELPDIARQDELVELLWQAYATKESYKKMILATDEMVKSQFIEMFGDPITNSKKCIVKKGSELFIFSSGKANTRANLNASYKFDCFGGNGTTGKSKDYLIDFTTLVIGRVGEYCGSVHITPTYSWITDNAIYIKDFKDKDLDIKYLYYLFRFLDLHRLSAKTGQPKITQEALLGIDYICPNVEEQKGYVTFAHHADKSKFELKQAIEKIDKVMRALMQ
jgi:type I restriction enzyme S subunit